MSKYMSRRYIREKWESLKWDMEHLILYGEGDQVEEEDLERAKGNIVLMMDSIQKELGLKE